MIIFYDTFSLDDMLLVNSEIVQFDRPTTYKQFNQFLKHWIRGSNPRLQYMCLKINDSKSREVLLKGIHYVDVAEEEKQEISDKGSFPFRTFGSNMVRIRQKDGTSAVIATRNSVNLLWVCFIAFH
ncbi:hypothetical protein GCK72_025938 [Caenorhabditis remanei]|uniref:Sdz-33 F-box domain-containing protein n=1 Tax=Caenorhabditis remanei TaxID=31234 RepID=A0A6A5G3I3_CAERE|nr:hypothetical protein GCK72_025938 [Caenorhabditis remanei]KAF1749470.1 hypothetical protein GCK72_025938 [Caenorhabditis remanei]